MWTARKLAIGAIVVALLIGVSAATMMIYRTYRCENFDFEGKFHARLRNDNEYFCMCNSHVYVRDANKSYFRLKDYHAESFEVLPHFYAKDKDSVYHMALVHDQLSLIGDEVRKIEGADPQSFEVLSDMSTRDKRYNYQLFGYHEIRRTPRS